MADRAANRRRLVRTVESVTVPQVQSEGAKHTLVLPLPRTVGRNDDVAISDDLLPFLRLERLVVAIGEFLDDVDAVNGDLRPVRERDALAAVEVNETEPPLLGLLHE